MIDFVVILWHIFWCNVSFDLDKELLLISYEYRMHILRSDLRSIFFITMDKEIHVTSHCLLSFIYHNYIFIYMYINVRFITSTYILPI